MKPVVDRPPSSRKGATHTRGPAGCSPSSLRPRPSLPLPFPDRSLALLCLPLSPASSLSSFPPSAHTPRLSKSAIDSWPLLLPLPLTSLPPLLRRRAPRSTFHHRSLARMHPLNLKVLQRHDPSVSSIISSATYVVLYHFVQDEWNKAGIEGPMFIYRR